MPIGRLNTNQSKVSVPIGAFADKLMQYGRQQEAKVLQEQQMAKEDERFQTNLGFKNRQEDRLTSKIQSDKDKELANNEAMSAILHPEKYSQEQRASILGNSHVDQSKLFNTETALYKRNATTPGTAEYEALKLASRDEKDHDADRNWKYAKKLEDYSLGRRQTLQNARLTRADTKESKAKTDKANLAKVYKDMLNVSPTQQVDKVVNQVAIDSIGNNQLKYGKAYTDFMDKAGFADLDGKRIELSNKFNTTINPKAKAELGKELDTVMKRLDSLKSAANILGNSVVGSIGLQDLPKPIVRQETEQKPMGQYTKELTGIIPEDLASANVYKLAESLINKNYKKPDPTAEGFKQAIKTYGGKVPKTNDPKVLEAVAKSVLKQSEKKIGKKSDRDYGKSLSSSKMTDAGLTNMFDNHGIPDTKLFGFIGTETDKIDLEDTIRKARADNNVPDDVSAKWIIQLTDTYSNDKNDYITRWGVTEKPFEDAYMKLANAWGKTHNYKSK